jgi:hypothetical protein
VQGISLPAQASEPEGTTRVRVGLGVEVQIDLGDSEPARRVGTERELVVGQFIHERGGLGTQGSSGLGRTGHGVGERGRDGRRGNEGGISCFFRCTHRLAASQRRQRREDVRELSLDRVVEYGEPGRLQARDLLIQCVDKHRERQVVLELRRRTGQNEVPARAGASGDLSQQPRLADPRFARHLDRAGHPRSSSSRIRSSEPSSSALPTKCPVSSVTPPVSGAQAALGALRPPGVAGILSIPSLRLARRPRGQGRMARECRDEGPGAGSRRAGAFA